MINFLISLLARVVVPVSRIFMYVFFGIASSIAWLSQFLRMDKLPEPAKMILKIFFWGAIITLPVFAVEFGSAFVITKINLPPLFISILYWFLAIAFVEEFFKYLVVRTKVLKNPVFDEPTDAMIYMIVAALGFAALENILYLLPPAGKIFSLNELFIRTAFISFFRFIGATFLHALCSGLVGYFLAFSIDKNRKETGVIVFGLSLATLLHGFYNFFIMETEPPIEFIIPIVILLGLSLFVTLGFKKLKKIKSICLP